MSRFAWLFMVLAACKAGSETDTDIPIDTDSDLPVDADGDGYDVTADCDDGDENVHPGATEICDGLDQDCAGGPDDGLATVTWYSDADQDTFGDASTAESGCAQPDGTASNGDDCDDGDADVNPAAAEVCDDLDQDCDGEADEGLTFATYYTDADGDGFGNASSGVLACDGATTEGGDCDDGDGAVNPAANELCNTIDDDCDAEVDEDAIDGTTYYADADGDAFGDAASATVSCAQPSGSTEDASDCDDTDADVFPGAAETCDGEDDDCDGDIDDDPTDPLTFYLDADSDGFGEASTTFDGCSPLDGFVAVAGDCGVYDPATFPGAPETCDSRQNDCDAATWTQQDEDGTASVPDGVGSRDVTADLLAGVFDLPIGQSLNICTGTWDVQIEAHGRNTVTGVGGDVVLTGANTHPILTGVEVGELYIYDLAFESGSGGSGQAACLSSLGTVLGDSLSFYDCEGSISAHTAMILDDVDIELNQVRPAVDIDGALLADGLTIIDSQAAFLATTGSTTTITSSSFTHNVGGGSITGDLEFRDVEFAFNGAGLTYTPAPNSTATLASTQFHDLALGAAPAFSATLSGNSSFILQGSEIVDNQSQGAVFVIDGTAMTAGSFVFDDSRIDGNVATTGTSAVLVELGPQAAPVGEIRILDSQIDGGSASEVSSLDAWSASLDVRRTAFDGGTANALTRFVATDAVFESVSTFNGSANGLDLTVANHATLTDYYASGNGSAGLRLRGSGAVDLIASRVSFNSTGVEFDGNDVTCTSTATSGALEGVYANTLFGVVYGSSATARFESAGCDFGVGSDANGFLDVFGPTVGDYGNDATFVCDSGGCAP